MACILVVDNEAGVRRAVCDCLKNDGCEIVSAATPAEARKVLATREFDVLISDVDLPGMTGLELLRVLRQAAPRMRVILMSGAPTVESAAEAVRSGAADYLVKPVSKAAICRSVGHALQVKKLDDERERLEAANRQYQLNLETLVDERTTQLNTALGDVRTSMEDGVYAVARLVERRDLYTSGHQRRVAALAAAVAAELHLPDTQLAGLRFAALIHDVGKVTVPAEILSKPGKLNRFELALIRTHPEAGHEVFKNVRFPWPIADVLYQHHERIDGSGYPRGLAGDAILLEARILGVADVVEAMSSHRPYRPALGIDKALEEIVCHAGTLYDSAVAAACKCVLTDRQFRFE